MALDELARQGWILFLRSGKYTKTAEPVALRGKDGGYSAFGVLCDNAAFCEWQEIDHGAGGYSLFINEQQIPGYDRSSLASGMIDDVSDAFRDVIGLSKEAYAALDEADLSFEDFAVALDARDIGGIEI